MNLKKALRHPLMSKVDFRTVPLKNIVDNLNNMYGGMSYSMAHPDQEVLAFYLHNHAVSVVRHRLSPIEPLGKYSDVIDSYFSMTQERAERLWYYMLLIVSREARHVKKVSSFTSVFKDAADPVIYSYINNIPSNSDSAAKKLRDAPPKGVTIGAYLEHLSKLFHTCNWAGGYGGSKWGCIVDCALSYAKGEYSTEMFLDTAFTLCHNNGPIFNKGMLYDHYSGKFINLLDIQRGGQIPQFFSDVESQIVSPNKSNRDLYDTLLKTLGSEFSGHVDWYMVDKWGVHQGNYEDHKKKQHYKYGLPEWYKEEHASELAALEFKKKNASLIEKKTASGMVYKVLDSELIMLERSEL